MTTETLSHVGETKDAPEPRPRSLSDQTKHRALLHGYSVLQEREHAVISFPAYAASIQARDRYIAEHALPSLEEPGTACPRCSEPLRLVGLCCACGWRGPEGAA
jgi:hypothetical protein